MYRTSGFLWVMVGLVDLDQEKRWWFLYSGKTEKYRVL
jgi:hypothetical protein